MLQARKSFKNMAAVLAAAVVMTPLAGCRRDVRDTSATVEDKTVSSVSETEKPAESTTEATASETSETTVADPVIEPGPYEHERELAVEALAERMNESRNVVYVYKDFGLSENHFTQKAKLYGTDPHIAKDLDENCQLDADYDGDTCIRCAQTTRDGDWNAWLWLNGYVPEGSTDPVLNKGDRDGQGLDLTGAEYLRFEAKTNTGEAEVEFFACGFGYDEYGVKVVKYPDSSKKRIGRARLTDEWETYTINLQSADLSYVVCGFGYAIDTRGNGSNDVIFYLDNIRFEGEIEYLKDAPVMIRSYDTQEPTSQNVAYTYDQSVSLMSFLAAGRKEEAKALADALVYAVRHDRAMKAPYEETAGGAMRIRNAYMAGEILPAPGWGTDARIPGWYDYEKMSWFEERTQVGSGPGVTSFAILALCQYYYAEGGQEYLDTAKSLMDWIIENCSDTKAPGFTGGFDGWEEADPQVVYKNTYRSTEHNIDIMAAARMLYEITGEEKYREASESAKAFVESMYDPVRKVFFTGTKSDGVTPDKSTVVLDAQVWCALAMGDDFAPYMDALETVGQMRTEEGGFPFCQENRNGGMWIEGSAFTALMYRKLGDEEKYKETMDAIVSFQREDGSFPAASVDHLSTGIYLFDGSLWEYGKETHIVPAAWMILANSGDDGFNPYVLGG